MELNGVSDPGYFIVFYFFLQTSQPLHWAISPFRVILRKSRREMLAASDLRGHPGWPPLFRFECNAAQKFPGGNNLGRGRAMAK